MGRKKKTETPEVSEQIGTVENVQTWATAGLEQKQTFVSALRDSAIQQRLAGDGIVMIAVNPEYYDEFLDMWSKVSFVVPVTDPQSQITKDVDYSPIRSQIQIEKKDEVIDFDVVTEGNLETIFLQNWLQRSGMMEFIRREKAPIRFSVDSLRAAYLMWAVSQVKSPIVKATAGIPPITL